MGLGVAEAEDDSFGFLQRFRVFLFCLALGRIFVSLWVIMAGGRNGDI